MAPDEGGTPTTAPPVFDPTSGLFPVVDAHPAYGVYFAKPADGNYGLGRSDYTVWGKGVLLAIDYKIGKTRWTHELGTYGSGAGVLTTDSGVTFTGDANGNFCCAHLRWHDVVACRFWRLHRKLPDHLRTDANMCLPAAAEFLFPSLFLSLWRPRKLSTDGGK